MASTFTSNYQIKLIGDGLESGTWGESTNENLERIEQALGQSALVNVESAGTASAWVPATHTLMWRTDNAGNKGAPNSDGRARYVEFISTAQFNTPVTVKIRGDTDLIYPDRVYIVKNSINTGASNANSDLILDVGANDDYTVRPGAFALVVANASTAITGTDRDAGSVFNALSDLQIENLIFGNSADITIRDNETAALEIKSTVANTEFLRFDTDNNHLEIAPGSAINNIDLISNTITTSTQATALQINTSNVAALDIRSNTDSLLKFDTSVTGDMIVVGAENIDATSTSKDLDLKDAEASALSILHGGTEFVRLNTNAGSNPGVNTVELLANQCDLDVQLGNKLLVRSGATLDVDGLSQLSIVTIDGGSVNAGSINNTSIGVTGASTVRGGRFTQDPSYYNAVSNGYTFGDGTAPSGFLKPSALSVVKLRQSDGGSLGFIRSSEMIHAADGSTGYFTDDWEMPAGTAPPSSVYQYSINFNHGFSSTPKVVNWYWEKITATPPGDEYSYDTGDRISAVLSNRDPLNNGYDEANASQWKNSTQVGFELIMNQWYPTLGHLERQWAVPSKFASATYPMIHINGGSQGQDRDWKLVVEAWE